MPQTESVICRQACVACWSDILVKTTKHRCISSSKPLFDAFLGLFGQINIWVCQSCQSDFIMMAIRAKRLPIQTKTTHLQPTFTFRMCEEMSWGTLNKMNFQLVTEVRIYSQPKKMRPTGPLP